MDQNPDDPGPSSSSLLTLTPVREPDDPHATPSYSYMTEMLDGIDLPMDLTSSIGDISDINFSPMIGPMNPHMTDHNYAAPICRVRYRRFQRQREPSATMADFFTIPNSSLLAGDESIGSLEEVTPFLGDALAQGPNFNLSDDAAADASLYIEPSQGPSCSTVPSGFGLPEQHVPASPDFDQTPSDAIAIPENPQEFEMLENAPESDSDTICRIEGSDLSEPDLSDEGGDDDNLEGEKAESEKNGNETKFDCTLCGKTFSRRSNRNRHEISCQKKRSKKMQPIAVKYCSVCGKSFRTQSKLKRHLMHHVEVKPHECNVCLKAFTQKEHLKRHLATHVGESSKTFKCEECEKGFLAKWELNRHIGSAHPKEWKLKCGWCEKGFNSYRGYEAHTAWHIEERGYFCDECEIAFKHRWDLESHLCTHTGEKQFQCAKCGHQFIQRIQLDRHIWKVHAVVSTQPQEPEPGPSSSKDDSTLEPTRVSARVPLPQTRKKPSEGGVRKRFSTPVLKCTECDKDFPTAQISWYLRHVRIVHGFTESPVICTYCGRFYRSKTLYQEHVNAEHYVRLKKS